jgi:hypothetical protein
MLIAIKKGFGTSTAEMLYGILLFLPAEFFIASGKIAKNDFIYDLREGDKHLFLRNYTSRHHFYY